MTKIFRKNDLKNINNFNILNFTFENDYVQELYEKYKDMTILEVRIDMCINEEYFYLDLSEMHLTNTELLEIFENPNIKPLLYKIEMLDLSYNNLSTHIDLNNYSNIKFLNISFNKINDVLRYNHIIELNCENNNITKIVSNSVIRLIAHNNIIEDLELENIEYLIVHDNKLDKISNYNNITTLNCINNNVLNIDYIKTLKCLCCSTNRISKEYSISNIDKINNNYYVDFI